MAAGETSKLGIIKRFFGSPIWQAVGAIVAIATLFAAYQIYSWQQQVKALQVVILANTSLVEVEPSVASDIKILYKEQPVANLSLLQVKIENVGNETIYKEDYDRPIKFLFPEDAKLIEAKVIETNPFNLFELEANSPNNAKQEEGSKFQIEQNTASLTPVLLNSEDRIIARFIVLDIPSDNIEQNFRVDARIAEVKNVPVVSAIEEVETGMWAREISNLSGVLTTLSLLAGFIYLLCYLAIFIFPEWLSKLRKT